MLYETVRLGYELYRQNEQSYDDAYIQYRLDRNPAK